MENDTKDTVTVELNIQDLFALTEYYDRLANSLDKSRFHIKTKAGTTLGDTFKKYQTKASHFQDIIDETWPK